jgi:Xaa-Pro aminopeptidase
MTRLHIASTHDTDMRYLVGSTVSDPVVYLEHDTHKRVFAPVTDVEALRATVAEGVVVEDSALYKSAMQGANNRRVALVLAIVQEANVPQPITVPASFPLDVADALRAQGYTLDIQREFCPERRIKSAAEIAQVTSNMLRVSEAFAIVRDLLEQATDVDNVLVHEGEPLSSERVKRAVEEHFFQYDLYALEGSIVSCGVHAAQPHHAGTGPLYAHQPIVVDQFPRHLPSGYYADMTRTFVKGTPTPELRAMYEAVLHTQEQALSNMAPGASCSELYEQSRTTLAEKGFETSSSEGYIHSLGHGLGLDIHEQPALNAVSSDVLEPGHVVTCEPGLYYNTHGGVRIEDTVVITGTGHTNLSTFPKDNWIVS